MFIPAANGYRESPAPFSSSVNPDFSRSQHFYSGPFPSLSCFCVSAFLQTSLEILTIKAISIFTCVASLYCGVGSAFFSGSLAFGLLVHLVTLLISFLLGLIGAAAITASVTNVDCGDVDWSHCNLTKGLQVIAWSRPAPHATNKLKLTSLMCSYHHSSFRQFDLHRWPQHQGQKRLRHQTRHNHNWCAASSSCLFFVTATPSTNMLWY